MLFHSGVNTAASAVVPMFPEGDRLAVLWLFVAMIVVVAVMVGRSHLLRSPSPHHVTLIRDTEVESGEVVVRKAPRPS